MYAKFWLRILLENVYIEVRMKNKSHCGDEKYFELPGGPRFGRH